MGLFEIQRQLAESGATAVRAEPARADHDDRADFLAHAWAHVRDPRRLARLYTDRARTDRDLALALARLHHGEPASLRALAHDHHALVAPLVTSRLFTPDRESAALQLVALGDPRSVACAELVLADPDADEHLRRLLADVVATWSDDRTCAALPVPAVPSPAAATLARRGHVTAQAALVTALRGFLNEWHKGDPELGWDEAEALVTAIGAARVADAVPLLLAALATPLSVAALHALAELAAPRAREPARAILRELGGTQPERQWAYRLAAERCLSALGEPQPLAAAREVLAHAHPRRYGYPRRHEVLQLRHAALAALVDRGDDDDRELVATHLASPYHDLRQLAAAALVKLGRDVPPLRLLDVPRCRELLASDGPAALIAALADPHVVYKDLVATALAAHEDPAARDAALTWALAHLERTPNHPVRYLEEDDLDVDSHAAVAIATRLHADANLRPRIAAAASPWIRLALFKGSLESPAPPPHAGPWRAAVRRLDRAPFVFGRQIFGLALDPAGARLAVVGDRLGQIVDARTGDLLVALGSPFTWAHDCAFSPDGAALAVAYHGCHVAIHDAATGQTLRVFDGFAGVPDGTKRLAFAPDGEHLAFAGSDGSARLVRWRTGETVWSATPRRGSFEAVAFDPDGTCLFSHVKTRAGEDDYLLRLDPATRKTTRVPATSSIWALARLGPRWYAGGEAKKIRPLTANLTAARTGALAQAEVVRLVAHGPALLAVSQTGQLLRWDPAAGTSTALHTGRIKLWALAVAADGTTYVAGTEGLVHRFTAAGAPLVATGGHVHGNHVTDIVPLADGRTLTSGWDGRLLRWPPEFGTADLLLAHDQRLTGVAVTADETTAYVGADERLFAVDLTTGEHRHAAVDGRVEDLLVHADTVHLVTSKGRMRSLAPDLSPRADVDIGDAATAIACTADGVLLVGTERGLLLELDAAAEVSWSRAEFGRDLVDKDPHGDPHRTVVGIAAHGGRFAAAANDDTLRVFDHASHRRTLRLFTPAGLFNNCQLSPDGRLVAVTAAGLAVFDATTGALLVQLSAAAFPGVDELTVVRFTAPRRALVGACNGALFEVTLEAP